MELAAGPRRFCSATPLYVYFHVLQGCDGTEYCTRLLSSVFVQMERGVDVILTLNAQTNRTSVNILKGPIQISS